MKYIYLTICTMIYDSPRDGNNILSFPKALGWLHGTNFGTPKFSSSLLT